MNKKYIVANWKMYPISLDQANNFREVLDQTKFPRNAEVIVCPPYPYLNVFSVSKQFEYGAQNISEHESGAFTGETSAFMLRELKAKYVIVGHSERRMHCSETNGAIKKKIEIAQANGLTLILCIGEPLDVYQQKQTLAYTFKQLHESLPAQFVGTKLIVAYEPIWAIGSGLTPKRDEIEEFTNAFKKEYNLPILYGGSVNVGFASEISAIKNLDGLLVGFASTSPEDFKNIINNYCGGE